MIDSASLRKRLSFIRYLYTLAARQANDPVPMAYVSVLTLHDSVELFLNLACEHHDVPLKNRPDFMEYWDFLNPKLDQPLGHKLSMRRLNETRRSLKHRGILPDGDAIQEFKATTHDFFLTNTPLIFSCNFEELSLVDLVSCQEARCSLKEAEEKLSSGDTANAATLAAKAYQQLIWAHVHTAEDRTIQQALRYQHRLRFSARPVTGEHREVASYLDQLHESVEAIKKVLLVLALGLDYQRYRRFNQLAPVDLVFMNAAGGWTVPRYDAQLSEEDCSFCIGFVVDCALSLQSRA